MKIRPSKITDLPDLVEMFHYGRNLQRLLGNHYQWQNGYPDQALLEQDIYSGNSYVCVVDEQSSLPLAAGTVIGTFYLCELDFPLFQTIQHGEWLNESPYVTVQRLCTNGKAKGVSQFCLNWINERYGNVKIYTHKTNLPMVHVIEKCGFQYCGEVVPGDQEPRNAYQYVVANQIQGVM